MKPLPKHLSHLIDKHHPLVEQIAFGNAVLFAGAGLSFGAGLPGWSGLLRKLANYTGVTPLENHDLLDVAERLEQQVGRDTLGIALRKILSENTGPTFVHEQLLSLPFFSVFTTNFDHIIEESLKKLGRAFDPVMFDEEVGVVDPSIALPVIKFHGDIDDPPGVVLTRTDYALFAARHPALAPFLEALLATRTFLFVGFSLTDPNFLALDETVRQALGRYRREAYAIVVGSAAERLSLQSPYRLLSVPEKHIDGFLVELAERAQALALATTLPEPMFVEAKQMITKSIAELVSDGAMKTTDGGFAEPTITPELLAKRPTLMGIFRDATRVNLKEKHVWRALGLALYRVGSYGAAARALGHADQRDLEVGRVLARCHWYLHDEWRAHRVLGPHVFDQGGDKVNIRVIDQFPDLLALYATAGNLVAEEHLDRRRYQRATMVALRTLAALDQWMDDAEPPGNFPRWLWRYLYQNVGLAHLNLLRSTGKIADHRDKAERAFRLVWERFPGAPQLPAWLYRLYVATSDSESAQRLKESIIAGGTKCKWDDVQMFLPVDLRL